MSLQSFIGTYGYVAIGLATFAEGEFALLIAAMAARRGYFQLPWVIAVSVLGSVSGDQIFFLLSRRQGPRILKKRPEWDESSKKVRRWMERHQILLMLSFRFITGVRTLTVILLGLSSVSAVRFFVLNVLGGALWAVTYGLAGYFLGALLQPVLERFKHVEGYAFLAVIALWICTLGFRRYRSRKKRQKSSPTARGIPGKGTG